MKYRLDIQGLRAFAVFAVLFFHVGILKNGYLGVDVFFVISGFLITGIIYNDFVNDKYSIKDFYIKRIRRILPLVFFVEFITLIVGFYCMLPDDFENLSQSVIATNFFSNNILQYITTGNYWDVVNEYKPLLHTWSLGVEEQYYLLFPILFLFINKRKKILFPILIIVTILSLLFYLFVKNDAFKFYLLPTRFFQISIGGITALVINRFKKNRIVADILLVLIAALTFVDFGFLVEFLSVFIVLAVSMYIIFNDETSFSYRLLSLRPVVFLGTISFSIYMWHQPILAFYRYIFSASISLPMVCVLTIIIILLSVLSHYYIEEYFRRNSNINFSKVFILVVLFFISTNIFSYYVYKNGGIIKDYPELNFTKKDAKRNINSLYNDRINDFNQQFPDNNNLNVLIIGDSYGRDWANLLLESEYKNRINISYVNNTDLSNGDILKLKKSDVIFVAFMTGVTSEQMSKIYSLTKNKIWIVGTKNFGTNNGIVYNKIRDDNFCQQKVKVQDFFLKIDEEQKEIWKSSYIDLLSLLKNKEDRVNVFTDKCKFISQDCRHLTKDGAIYVQAKINFTKYLNIKK